MKRCVLRFRINIRDFNTFVRGEAAKSRQFRNLKFKVLKLYVMINIKFSKK
jgi:hypothetical protein